MHDIDVTGHHPWTPCLWAGQHGLPSFGGTTWTPCHLAGQQGPSALPVGTTSSAYVLRVAMSVRWKCNFPMTPHVSVGRSSHLSIISSSFPSCFIYISKPSSVVPLLSSYSIPFSSSSMINSQTSSVGRLLKSIVAFKNIGDLSSIHIYFYEYPSIIYLPIHLSIHLFYLYIYSSSVCKFQLIYQIS